jgi:hypothetical protein
MHAPQGMMKSSVMGPWIHQKGHPHLGNSSQPLKKRMGDQFKNKFIWSSNKTVNWIVKNVKLIGFYQGFLFLEQQR